MTFGRTLTGLFLVFVLVSFASGAMAANNPVPLINQPLVPDAVAPGGASFTLTVNGTGFVSTSVVNWNGSPRATTFITKSQITAAITAADIATVGTASVTVVSPAPGGGTSNAAFFSVAYPTNSVNTLLASSPATGIDPVSIAVADFNGDGKLDLAVVNYDSFTVSILLGDGAGNFVLASSPTTGDSPVSVVVGDFNGDGKPDLAVANEIDDTVSILLGDGTGNFTLASSPATGNGPISIAVGDFNGDGKLDLAVANEISNTLSILLGDGMGNFTFASSPGTGNAPYSVAVGDLNGDGNLDLAVANFGNYTGSVLLGDGKGNFTLASSPIIGSYPDSVALGDFNADGKLDLAVANLGNNSISVLLGDGTGNFTLASSLLTGSGPFSIALGDFNVDGKLDLAVANSGSNTASIFVGDGTGRFTLAASPATGPDPLSVGVGDFNGDGQPDLAVANTNNGTLSIILQAPAVTLSPFNLTFPNQKVRSTSAPQEATLTNATSGTISVFGFTIGGPNPRDFSETNNCPSSLPAGSNCMIEVTFAPRDGGSRTAMLSASDDGAGSPQTISLEGTGLSVKLSPRSLDFGSVMVGRISQPMISTLTNMGRTPLTISSITVTGKDAGDFSVTDTCHGKVPPHAGCSIIVRFVPFTTGLRTAYVSITDNSGGSPQKIKLSGTGT